ncbi:MAG: asparagine synthase (glutamine-hydrolyzing) [Planctomycetota bacterium]|nr:MAG: asparagine synthase (glutamine-hydrolyzing) [Planctomycetota bacterium]
MCGIGGGVCLEGFSQEWLKRLAGVLRHRGPDDEGYFCEGKVGLAHRRLSVIDPQRGNQPMSDEEGRCWIVFNGAIYNYLELRQDLLGLGYRFRTHSDTEVILYAYRHWGKDCLERLNGMFAFVIYDREEGLLFGARDRLGIKPLYYYHDGNLFLFASEIKAILETGVCRARVDKRSLLDYLAFQLYWGERTLFAGIKRVLPGTFFTLKVGERLSFFRGSYWNLEPKKEKKRGEGYYLQRLAFLLQDSVRLRLRADVRLGSHLSGGLDSSLIASFASSLLDRPLETFTGKFSEKDFDESDYAKMVADSLGARFHCIEIGAKDFLNHIENVIYYMDEPQAGPGVFAQYMLSRYISEKVRVVLGGQGGDELFVGYVRYLLMVFEALFSAAIEGQEAAAREFQGILANLKQLRRYRPLVQFQFRDGLFEESSSRYLRLLYRFAGFEDLLNWEFFEGVDYDPREVFEEFFRSIPYSSLVDRMLYFDLKTSLPALLHVEDRTSMAYSLESRVPFLDHRLVEFAFSTPVEIKFCGGELKYLLRRVGENILPLPVLARRDKMGFPVPLNLWLRRELREWFLDLVASEQIWKIGIFQKKKLGALLENLSLYGRNSWAVICLGLWLKRFSVSE